MSRHPTASLTHVPPALRATNRDYALTASALALRVAPVARRAAGIERRDEAKGRLRDKDALDVFRLLRAVDLSAFAAGFARLRPSQLAADSPLWALSELENVFGESESVGVGIVVRAIEALMPEAEVLAAVPRLAREVLGWRRRSGWVRLRPTRALKRRIGYSTTNKL